MKTRISPTLNVCEANGTKVVCCSQCDSVVAKAGEHWKDKAVVKRNLVASLPGWSDSVHPELELREFGCPSCGQLLDSESSLPEDPYLYDVVHV